MSEKDARVIRQQFIDYMDSIEWSYDASGDETIYYRMDIDNKISELEMLLAFANDGLTIDARCPFRVSTKYRAETMKLLTLIGNLTFFPVNFAFDLDSGILGSRSFSVYDGLLDMGRGFSEEMIIHCMQAHPGFYEAFGDGIVDVAMGYVDADVVYGAILQGLNDNSGGQ